MALSERVSCRMTTVNTERGTGDEVVGGKHRHSVGYVFGIADTIDQMEAGQTAGVVNTVLGM